MPSPESHSLEASLHCHLAQAVHSDIALPPFDKAMMDGFALRSKDGPGTKKIVGRVAAGEIPDFQIGPGECAKINTGAPLPEGADAVQMIEKTRSPNEEKVEILEPVKPGQHVTHKGEDIKAGDLVYPAGVKITPSVIAGLASVGCPEPRVFPSPTIALLTTGNELVPPDKKPGPGQIRNSNQYSLSAQLKELGLGVKYLACVPDDREATRIHLKNALDCDVILVTGGVSMGDADFVHEILREMESAEETLKIHFQRIAIKPGKPFVFCTYGNKRIFCLPGNPVSCAVLFHLFVAPSLRKSSGDLNPESLKFQAVLRAPVKARPDEKTKFIPVLLACPEGIWEAAPVEYHGSADLVGYSRANALLRIDARNRDLEAGAKATVYPLNVLGVTCPYEIKGEME